MGEQLQGLDPVPGFKRYRSHKVVLAAEITDITYAEDSSIILHLHGHKFQVSHAWFQAHEPKKGWMLVLYPDGYVSASPVAPFEEGYALIADH